MRASDPPDPAARDASTPPSDGATADAAVAEDAAAAQTNALDAGGSVDAGSGDTCNDQTLAIPEHVRCMSMPGWDPLCDEVAPGQLFMCMPGGGAPPLFVEHCTPQYLGDANDRYCCPPDFSLDCAE